jgi:hypothetical protein
MLRPIPEKPVTTAHPGSPGTGPIKGLVSGVMS